MVTRSLHFGWLAAEVGLVQVIHGMQPDVSFNCLYVRRIFDSAADLPVLPIDNYIRRDRTRACL